MVYEGLSKAMNGANKQSLYDQVVPYLSERWLKQYWKAHGDSEIVETTHAGCSYLFDISRERLIAAWATSHGAHHAKRDANRMRSHPHNYGSLYHRGHCIPHSLGGPTDINLVPQLGKVNIGPFRVLEKMAVATPGAVYFTYWRYTDDAQMPACVEQGLLIAGQAPLISVHGN